MLNCRKLSGIGEMEYIHTYIYIHINTYVYIYIQIHKKDLEGMTYRGLPCGFGNRRLLRGSTKTRDMLHLERGLLGVLAKKAAMCMPILCSFLVATKLV